jgi:hypothetical protein
MSASTFMWHSGPTAPSEPMFFDRRYPQLTALAAGLLFALPVHAADDAAPRAVMAIPDQPAATIVTTTPRPAPVCIGDWSEAGPIVRAEGLVTIERVSRIARDKAHVEIVTSALCKAEERFVYRLTVRGQAGALRTMLVDARQPFGSQE